MSTTRALIEPVRFRRWLWPVLALLAALAALVIWLAPAEQTLGAGIRWVYLHVALTWTGMTALIMAGGLGLWQLWSGRAELGRWTRAVGLVGLGFFAGGMVVSLAAAQVNWGGVFLGEPRTRVNLQVLAVGLIVVVLATWWPGRTRLHGLLFAGLAAWLLGALALTPLVLHPRNPIMSSGSAAIQSTFLSLYLLGLVAASALVVHFGARRVRLVH